MSHCRNNLRWGAALTALAYLLGWTIAFAHNVTEQHVVCAEHGDLVHADAHGDHGDHEVVEAVETDSERPTFAVYPTHEDHEHCAIGPFFRSDDDYAVDAPKVSVERAIAANVATLSTPTEANRPPPVAILAYAPKTSPPTII